MSKGKPVRAFVGGTWRVVGTLRGNVFERWIKQRDILGIRKAVGVDLRYDPPLGEDTLVRDKHEDGAIYEIGFGELLKHPEAEIAKIGPLHPERIYLPYKYWRRIRPPAGQARQLTLLFDQRQGAGK